MSGYSISSDYVESRTNITTPSIQTTTDSSSVNINTRNYASGTTKGTAVTVSPTKSVSGVGGLVGAVIEANINSGISASSTATLTGLQANVNFLGGVSSATVAGAVTAVDAGITESQGTLRTIVGKVSHLRCRSTLSHFSTGKYSAVLVDDTGTRKLDSLVDISSGSGSIATQAVTGSPTALSIKIIYNNTTYYLPLYAAVA